MNKKRLPLRLFLDFFRISFYTFGGGLSIVAQMQREYVEDRRWISEEELLDITSVGRSLPGLMIGNVSYLFGYHLAGFPGALACLAGISIPPVLILTVVTWGYTQIRNNPYVFRAMTGVRAAVVPVMFTAVVGLRKGALTDRISWVLLLLGFVLYLILGVNGVLIVALGALLGYLIGTWRERKQGGHHGSP